MTGTPGAPAWNFCIRNSPGREEGNKEILNVEKKKKMLNLAVRHVLVIKATEGKMT